MEYRGRYITPNKACQSPRHMVFFDCETTAKQDSKKENKHHLTLRIGVAKDVRMELGERTRESKLVFTEPKQFWKWLEKRTHQSRLTTCYAHNAIFDLCTVDLTYAVDNLGWKVSAPWKSKQVNSQKSEGKEIDALIALECPPFILCLENERTKARVIFIDTLNYFCQPLEDLGKFTGLPKLPICFDECDDDELIDYCERDVDIIMESIITLIKWQSDLDLGNFRWTAPSNSWNSYRHKFMKHKIVLHDHLSAKKLERDSYYGGQTEVYSKEKISETVYMLDVSALYPSVMIDNLYPTKLIDYRECENGNLQCDVMQTLTSVASVRLNCENQAMPKRINGKTEYSVGCFDTFLAGPEMAFAAKNGMIQAIYKIATYECKPIFTEFVEYFWGMRLRYESLGNEIYAGLCKMFLNSLSGKFGQLTSAWQTVKGMLSVEPWTEWLEINAASGLVAEFRSIGEIVQQKIEQGDHPNSFCAISSFVTAFGRQRMRELRIISHEQNVFYQGVDSLIVNQTGYKNLVDANELHKRSLGKLRIKEVADSFHARGKMDYEIGNTRIIAGIKRNAVRVSDDTFIQTLFSGVDSLFNPAGERNITTTETQFTRKS